MITHSDSTHGKARRRYWFSVGEFLFRIRKTLFVAVLAILMFLLGEAMVHNRFFEGGRYHQNGSIGQ